MPSTISRDARTVRTATPTFAFLVAHPAHFIALGMGAGLSPVAPGTLGTLVALPIAWLLHAFGNTATWVLAIVAITLAGGGAAQVTARHLGVVDPPAVVIDEIAAFLFVLFFAGTDLVREAAAFVLFRVFDIAKPPPIRQVDRAMKNAVGVMGDDFLAAGYTLIVLAIAQRVLGA